MFYEAEPTGQIYTTEKLYMDISSRQYDLIPELGCAV